MIRTEATHELCLKGPVRINQGNQGMTGRGEGEGGRGRKRREKPNAFSLKIK